MMALVRNVICMKWGDAYAPAYVNVLYRAVQSSLQCDHRFICFTDDRSGIDPGVEVFPLPLQGLPEDRMRNGGWLKLAVFREDLSGLSGDTLFLDLDVLIAGSLDDFFTHAPELGVAIIHDWLPWGQSLYRRRGRTGNSSVFRFRIGEQAQIFDRFAADPARAYADFRNEQRFLTAHAAVLGYWPEEWCRSFKRHCSGLRISPRWRNPRIPPGARIIVFHGRPKPTDLVGHNHDWQLQGHSRDRAVPWVTDYWRQHSA